MCLKVAYLGPEGTYTHQAAVEYFGKDEVEFLFKDTIPGVIHSVSQKDASMGVVPVENSTFGIVDQTYDALRHTDIGNNVFVCGEHILPIKHCLLARRGVSLADITAVYSHQQALGQCANYLTETLPNAPRRPVSSTTAAVQLILYPSSEDQRLGAAIASTLSAQLHPEINILAHNIQDQEGNQTRFIMVTSNSEIMTQKGRYILLRFTPNTTTCNSRSIHLEILSDIPLAAITRIDRRPSLHPIPFQDTMFIELDISLISDNEPEAERLLASLLERAGSLGEASWIGKW